MLLARVAVEVAVVHAEIVVAFAIVIVVVVAAAVKVAAVIAVVELSTFVAAFDAAPIAPNVRQNFQKFVRRLFFQKNEKKKPVADVRQIVVAMT